MAKVYTTPGVYIEEKNAFPNSVVPVATAVPAFIGYTQKALRDKKDLSNVPTRISSFAEYLLYFGEGPKPTYDLTILDESIKKYQLSLKDGRYLLYLSMKLFFANGGSDCYIVSIGDYSQPVKKDDFFGKENIGIDTLEKEPEPTILVIPDSMLLGREVYGEVHQAMLAHCGKLASRFSILDVYMDENTEAEPDTKEIVEDFRNKIGDHNLQWGAAYYPWVETTIVGAESVNYTHITAESLPVLNELLTIELNKNQLIDQKRAASIKAEIDKLAPKVPETTEKAITLLHQTLLAICPLYQAIMNSIKAKINLLPPSGGIAGVYAMVDHTVGVFQSPANVSIGSVIKPLISISNEEQEDLNIPLNGKAINAIRTFPGKGVLIWGARTLDGNSHDWRYVSVRRTVIFIEQSIKNATAAYVFEPITAETWTTVKAMITNFLTNVWQSGGLIGATPEQAFGVDVGLGTTMTAADIQEGTIKIMVRIAVTRPAEFIVLNFEQKMQQS